MRHYDPCFQSEFFHSFSVKSFNFLALSLEYIKKMQILQFFKTEVVFFTNSYKVGERRKKISSIKIQIVFLIFGLLVFIPGQSVLRAQIPEIWCMGSFLPILAPRACMQIALKKHAQLPAMGLWAGGWVAATVSGDKID